MYLSIAEMYENAFIQATTSGSLVYCYWQNCFGHFCSSFFCISSYFPGLIPIMKLPKTHQHFLGFKYIVLQFSSVQSLSRVRLFSTPWIAAHQASLSITNPRSSLRLTSIESVMPSSHLILCRPLLLLPNPSQHQSLFQWVNSSHELAKVLKFQLLHQSLQWPPMTDLL